MGQEDTFTLAFDLYQRVMVHATGHPAKCLAVSVAASIVFVAACIGYGLSQARFGSDES